MSRNFFFNRSISKKLVGRKKFSSLPIISLLILIYGLIFQKQTCKDLKLFSIKMQKIYVTAKYNLKRRDKK